MSATVDAAPFRQFIVKVHSRCNLSCTYCYVYHHPDQTWRGRPFVMSEETAAAATARIAEHAARHALADIVVVLHGGEPLLAGSARLARLVDGIRSKVPRSTHVEITLQTNGTLLSEGYLDFFHRQQIAVGVSLDGGRGANDRHRRFADGRPSFDLVARGLRLLARAEYRDVYAGLLCTIDLANDPVTLYEDLLSFRPPQLDLLLPLGNWVHPPPGRRADRSTPYGDWLVAVFDRWFSAPRRETGIRLFESLIALLVGGSSETEAVGLDSSDAITIETDGALEITDALKSTAHGMGATGLNVHRNCLDEAARHPGVRAMRRDIGTLADACRSCPVVAVCGGGQFAHRYGDDGGFDHRSVYCADLYCLIDHVRQRLYGELTARRARQVTNT
jgi:uncharacterized protein